MFAWKDQKISEIDLLPYKFPTPDEFGNKKVEGIFLGYFFAWDGHENAEIAIKNGSNMLRLGSIIFGSRN